MYPKLQQYGASEGFDAMESQIEEFKETLIEFVEKVKQVEAKNNLNELQ